MKSSENYGFPMILEGTEVDLFVSIHLILEVKFGDNLQNNKNY